MDFDEIKKLPNLIRLRLSAVIRLKVQLVGDCRMVEDVVAACHPSESKAKSLRQ